MQPNTQIGRYRVLAKLGAGGMGEVYRARDTRLERDVALKVLPAELASDPDRLARLEREAQVLASLEHPNIAAVYGLEQLDGSRFLVMQLASGVTLEDRLASGAIPVDEVAAIALQLARGLEAAHENGVIHRDLKPANVMLDDDGGVKVLDFGLAKPAATADSVELTASPTMLDATGAGVIMGTAAYMSPEQARGRRVDKRADIWAFGCVLYEMLTGERLFDGESLSDVLAAVLREEIDFEALPASTPDNLLHLLERALEREAGERLRDIGEARIALERGSEAVEIEAPVEQRSPVPLAIVAILGVAIGGLAVVAWQTPNPEPLLQLDIAPEGLQTGTLIAPQVSPDGSRVLYGAQNRLWVRDLDRATARGLPDADSPRIPFWAHDSRELAYYSDGSLWRYSIDDGTKTAITTMPEPASGGGGTWDESGRLLVAQGSTDLFSIPARGGSLTPLFDPDPDLEEAHFHRTVVLPNGALVYIVHRVDGTADTIGVSRNGERRNILTLEGDYLAGLSYSPEGALMFSRIGPGGDGLWVVAFDAASLQIEGEPAMLVADGLSPSLSADGHTLLYVPGTGDGLRGTRGRFGILWDPANDAEMDFRLLTDYMPLVNNDGMQTIASNGNRLVVSVLEQSRSDLWILDLDNGNRRRLTDDASFDLFPTFSEDGEWIYFTRNDMRVARVPTSGGPIEELGDGRAPVPARDRLLVRRPGPGIGPGQELWFLDAVPGGDSDPFRVGRNMYGTADVSADGRLVAFATYETGEWQIQVEDLESGQDWQVTIEGGEYPRWAPDGNLYIITPPRTISRIDVTREPGATPVFAAPIELTQLTPSFSVASVTPIMTDDGIRFLAVEVEAVNSGGRLILVRGADQLIRDALGR